MAALTKFDVLRYVAESGEIGVGKLIGYIKGNAEFEGVPERKVKEILNRLKKEGSVLKGKGGISLDINGKTIDTLTFVLWCSRYSVDYNAVLRNKAEGLFKKVFEKYMIENIIKVSEFSKPTTLRLVDRLSSINFISVTKRKPLAVKVLVNDRTLFFLNILDCDFDAFQKVFGSPVFERRAMLKEELIKLHVYSTTVTEGNTATEGDIERVLKNAKTGLSPREVIEIINAKSAIDELFNVYKTEDLSLALIKKLHTILMSNIVESPGEFSYVRKRVIGSPVKFPESKLEVDTSIAAMINFYNKHRGDMNPLILAPLVHFIFVSIHPFIDGNGRVARLLHSLILMKHGLPIFAFDPDHRNAYFSLLDKGRSESVEDFIFFCIEKHRELVGRPERA